MPTLDRVHHIQLIDVFTHVVELSTSLVGPLVVNNYRLKLQSDGFVCFYNDTVFGLCMWVSCVCHRCCLAVSVPHNINMTVTGCHNTVM